MKRASRRTQDFQSHTTILCRNFEGGDTVWDENKIEFRTARLGEEVLAVWGLGDCPTGLLRPKLFGRNRSGMDVWWLR